jgi:hypothetical protein
MWRQAYSVTHLPLQHNRFQLASCNSHFSHTTVLTCCHNRSMVCWYWKILWFTCTHGSCITIVTCKWPGSAFVMMVLSLESPWCLQHEMFTFTLSSCGSLRFTITLLLKGPIYRTQLCWDLFVNQFTSILCGSINEHPFRKSDAACPNKLLLHDKVLGCDDAAARGSL